MSLHADRAAKPPRSIRTAGRAWPIDWQRLYAALRGLVEAGTAPDEVVPGVTVHSEDVSRRPATQCRYWLRLCVEQRGRLADLGIGWARLEVGRESMEPWLLVRLSNGSGPCRGHGPFRPPRARRHGT